MQSVRNTVTRRGGGEGGHGRAICSQRTAVTSRRLLGRWVGGQGRALATVRARFTRISLTLDAGAGQWSSGARVVLRRRHGTRCSSDDGRRNQQWRAAGASTGHGELGDGRWVWGGGGVGGGYGGHSGHAGCTRKRDTLGRWRAGELESLESWADWARRCKASCWGARQAAFMRATASPRRASLGKCYFIAMPSLSHPSLRPRPLVFGALPVHGQRRLARWYAPVLAPVGASSASAVTPRRCKQPPSRRQAPSAHAPPSNMPPRLPEARPPSCPASLHVHSRHHRAASSPEKHPLGSQPPKHPRLHSIRPSVSP